MLAEWTREDLTMALDDVAKALLSEAGILEPPVDAFALAARLGIAVAPDNRQAGRARYVRLRSWGGGRPRPAIMLRTDARPEREHWAVAHEIGEHAAYRVFEQLGVDARGTAHAREAVANELAARLLLPAAWFFVHGRACYWNLPALKRQYRTASHELIARRMLDAAPPIIVSVFDQGKVGLRRGNRAGGIPPVTEAEAACQQKAHRSGLPSVATGHGYLVHAWPVHEPGWRREILRMELDEYCDYDLG